MDMWYFNKEQTPQKVTALDQLAPDGFVWIDAQSDEILNVLNFTNKLTDSYLNERHVKDCLNPQHPCFYDSTQLYDFLIFRSLIAEHQNQADIETAPISFILYHNLLISFNNNDDAIARVKSRFAEPRKRLPSEPISLLQVILNEIVDNFLALKSPLFERFTFWEGKLLDSREQFSDWIDLLHFKTEVRKLRSLSEDQQDVIYQWRQDSEMGITEQLSVRFNDLADHVRRILRYTLQLENEIDSLIQLHYSKTGNRTNQIMRVLTALSAIFLPLNLIAGIFGMNFQNLKFFTHPYGPEITLWGMFLVGFVLLIFFKLKDWI